MQIKNVFRFVLLIVIVMTNKLFAQSNLCVNFIENIGANVSIKMIEIKINDEDTIKFKQIPNKTFYISQTEITQTQWNNVMVKQSTTNRDSANMPVTNISWEEANEFCIKLSKLTQKDYQLPSRTQFRYVANEGDSTYSKKNNFDSIAWYEQNSNNKVHPVANKAPNLFSVYDIFGNVSEWCGEKCYGPAGPLNSGYICEGGSFRDDEDICINTYRFYGGNYRLQDIGFRVVCHIK